MRNLAKSLFAMVGGALLVAATAGSILAAGPPAKVTVTTPDYPEAASGAHIVPCGVDIRLEALVVDADDAPVEGITMAWTWEEHIDLPPTNPDDSIGDASSVTGANGVAVSTVNLACVVGLRGVSAGTQGALNSVRLSVETVPEPVPAPNTAVAGVPDAPPTSALDLSVVLVALGGAFGGLAFLQRRRRSEAAARR